VILVVVHIEFERRERQTGFRVGILSYFQCRQWKGKLFSSFLWPLLELKAEPLLSMQIAYALIEEKQGMVWEPDKYISFVGLLAHERYCGMHFYNAPVKQFLDIFHSPRSFVYEPLYRELFGLCPWICGLILYMVVTYEK
jgi:hypothetical protein